MDGFVVELVDFAAKSFLPTTAIEITPANATTPATTRRRRARRARMAGDGGGTRGATISSTSWESMTGGTESSSRRKNCAETDDTSSSSSAGRFDAGFASTFVDSGLPADEPAGTGIFTGFFFDGDT